MSLTQTSGLCRFHPCARSIRWRVLKQTEEYVKEQTEPTTQSPAEPQAGAQRLGLFLPLSAPLAGCELRKNKRDEALTGHTSEKMENGRYEYSRSSRCLKCSIASCDEFPNELFSQRVSEVAQRVIGRSLLNFSSPIVTGSNFMGWPLSGAELDVIFWKGLGTFEVCHNIQMTRPFMRKYS